MQRHAHERLAVEGRHRDRKMAPSMFYTCLCHSSIENLHPVSQRLVRRWYVSIHIKVAGMLRQGQHHALELLV